MSRRQRITVETLPEETWDRLLVLKDVIIEGFDDPGKNLDEVYELLQREFSRDTGMMDITPDFLSSCKSLHEVYRYLNRMNVSVADQIEHIHQAFEPLGEYMELVFRPRTIGYTPNYWPSKPIETPFAPIGDLEVPELPEGQVHADPFAAAVRASQAQRVLTLGPLALSGVERLIEELELLRLDNNPPHPLLGEEVDALRRLHRELGELLRTVKAGRPFQQQLEVVRKTVSSTFRFVKDTGELMVAGLPPLTAAALPAWGTLKICETILKMEVEPSATMAAGVIAGTYALASLKKEQRKGPKRRKKD